MRRSRLCPGAFALLFAALCTGSASGSDAQFSTLAPLPQGYFGHTLIHADGHLYNIGGLGSASGIFAGRDVHHARITGPGTIDGWAPQPPLPMPIFYHAAAASGKTLYVIGGYHFASGMVPSAQVFFCQTGPDGTAGPWSETTPLPQALYLHSAAVWEGTLYVTGGWSPSGLSANVFSADVQADGGLGPWRVLASLPEAVYTHATVQNGTLYVLGGVVNGGQEVHNGVYYAPILPDKTIAPWQMGTPLPEPLSSHAAAVSGGRIYVNGGFSGAAITAAHYSAQILSGGAVGEWGPAPDLPRAIYFHAAAASAEALFVSGGTDGPNYQSAVYSLILSKPEILAAANFSPNSLNVNSRGKTISLMLEFPDGAASAAAINPASVKIVSVNGRAVAPIAAEEKNVSLGDANENLIPDLTLKFARAALIAVLDTDDNAVGFSGELADGTAFSASDMMWAAAPGKRKVRRVRLEKERRKTPMALPEHSSEKSQENSKRGYRGHSAGEDGSPAFGNVYAFPNPARGGAAPTLHVEAGEADSIDISIYDLSGERVHGASLAGPAPLIDDGSGQGAVPAFEYSWDVSGVASGVYIYAVTAHKDGTGSAKILGKTAVIK